MLSMSFITNLLPISYIQPHIQSPTFSLYSPYAYHFQCPPSAAYL
jgi:tRNA A37 threonylcarbamoyladenosine biosynthesis protein TsaE